MCEFITKQTKTGFHKKNKLFITVFDVL